ncbi:MAG: hypothetical protein NVSMB4_06820 [Acidimicrobiales bacterium]
MVSIGGRAAGAVVTGVSPAVVGLVSIVPAPGRTEAAACCRDGERRNKIRPPATTIAAAAMATSGAMERRLAARAVGMRAVAPAAEAPAARTPPPSAAPAREAGITDVR